MKSNRRSLKIKAGASVVDVKLKGRVEKAQMSFAKAVLFSLLLLVAVGVYVRWDSLMDLRSAGEVTNAVIVSDKEQSGEQKALNLRGERDEEFAKKMVEFKTQVPDKHQSLRTPSSDSSEAQESPPASSSLSPPTTVPILSEEEKVKMNHPKKEVYLPITSKIKEVNKANIAQLRYEVGNFQKELPLKPVSLETASKTQMKVVPTANNQVVLLTGAASVSASVDGNLGPPGVVISPIVSDWLKDRWQAAKDMTGAPIPGPHWLQFDLPKPASALNRILIDFEVALSNDYSIDIFCISTNAWQPVHDTRVADALSTKKLKKDKMHIFHEITLKDKDIASMCKSFDKLKMKIRRPATRFGTSIWRFEAYGTFK